MPVTLDITDDFLDVVDNLEAVTVRPPLGESQYSELLTNGDFDTDLVGWTASNFTWEERLALSDATSGSSIIQSIATTAGVQYILAFDLMTPEASVAGVAVKIGTSSNGSQIASYTPSYSGRHVRTFTATGSTTWLTFRGDDRAARYGNITCRRLDDTSVASALRRAINTREVFASAGQLRQGDVRWHIYETQLTSPPALGALIIDANSTEWTVLGVDRETLDSRWRCLCRNNAVASVDETLVTIKKHELTKGDGGAQKAVPVTWAASVRARIQRQEAPAPLTENGRRYLPGPVEIYCRDPFVVDQRFQVVDSHGQTFKVTGYRYPDDIMQPFTILAEQTPWPLS